MQLGDVYGGSEAARINTWRKLNPVEALIKVKDNFIGFVPASIEITY